MRPWWRVRGPNWCWQPPEWLTSARVMFNVSNDKIHSENDTYGAGECHHLIIGQSEARVCSLWPMRGRHHANVRQYIRQYSVSRSSVTFVSRGAMSCDVSSYQKCVYHAHHIFWKVGPEFLRVSVTLSNEVYSQLPLYWLWYSVLTHINLIIFKFSLSRS